MTKKQILTAGATAVLLLASAAFAFAQTASTTTPVPTPAATTTATTTTPTPVPMPAPSPTPAPATAPMPVMRQDAKNTVQIGPEGNALIRGTVNAVGTNSITVNSWGGIWTINATADTEITPKSTSTPFAFIRQGDFVSVNGKIDAAQPWTVNAHVIRDADAGQSLRMMQKQMRMHVKEDAEKMRQNIKQIKQKGKDEIKDLRKKQEEERKKIQDLRKHNGQTQNRNGQ